ncbi:MAG: hypothetical protein ABIA74_02640 [bacterium]
MFKKLFFIASLFLFSSIFAKEENQKTSNVEGTQQEVKIKSKYLDYLLELYANDKWGFMGKKFIDELNALYDRRSAQFKQTSFTILGTTLGLVLLILILKSQEHPDVEMQLWGAGGVFFLITALIYKLIIKLNTDNRNITILTNFLLKWHLYKKVTPEELHLFFEKFIQKLKRTNFIYINSQEAREIIEGIQSQIINNHLKYYGKHSKLFDSTY